MATKALEIGIDEAAKLLDTTEAELRNLARSNLIPKPADNRLPMIKTVQAYVRQCRDPRLNEAQVAAAVGVTRTWIRTLTEQGVLKKERDGFYRLESVWRAMLDWARDQNRRGSRGDSDSALRDVKRRKLEMDIAVREGELIETADAIDMVDYSLGQLRGDLAGVPARVTRDIALRRSIEAEIDSALERACGRLQEAADASKRGVNILAEEEAVLAPPSARRGRRKTA